MILLRKLRLMPGEPEERLKAFAAKKLRVRETDILNCAIVKKSLDARKKNDIHYIYTLALELRRGEKELVSRCSDGTVSEWTPKKYEIPVLPAPEKRPLIVGFGPAGMFAALVLAKAGVRPLVIERGSRLEERVEKVEKMRRDGVLDPECNVQFGEGGAGTFSDGKLNTGIKDARIPWVLEQFALHGAPEHIRYDAKPHVGTDVLETVVRGIREEILSLGGEIMFDTRFVEPVISDGCISGAVLSKGGERFTVDCDRLILAAGHSARDLFERLHEMKIPMEPKAFSMGVRVEHLQADINRAQYGEDRKDLPPADYSLNVSFPDGSSAYTFCMCPGGEVIAAASEDGRVVTNGMSRSGRDGVNANAALLVTLKPEDFPGEGVLAGMYWQREIERTAFLCGGGNYAAPAQRAEDFIAGRPSEGPGKVIPSYRPGVCWCDINTVLPEKICSVLRQAIPALGRKLEGYDDPDAVLTAPETRSSSPVRILRGEDCSSSVRGLYPCGEGAGYAGGITSAAVDGMRCAEAVLKSLISETR